MNNFLKFLKIKSVPMVFNFFSSYLLLDICFKFLHDSMKTHTTSGDFTGIHFYSIGILLSLPTETAQYKITTVIS